MPLENPSNNPLMDSALAIGQPADTDRAPAAKPAKATEPQEGSYERFMSSFGNPSRWAGR